MGSSQSIQIPKSKMEDYLKWTYLNEKEILTLYEKFESCFYTNRDPNFILEQRIHVKEIFEKIPQIKYNIFCDRIIIVFSSKQDGCFSFEDLLDFFSVMSDKCPVQVKARWAYKLFDFNNQKEINPDDIRVLIKRLTSSNSDQKLSDDDVENILQVIMSKMDVEDNNSIGCHEFEHVLKNLSHFESAFTCEP
nr:calcium and integrin-binding protein 1-like [Onthophagus taurus]